MRPHPSTDMAEESGTAALFHRHAPAIFAYLCSHAPTREDAEDLLLEVFLAAIERGHLAHLAEDEQQRWLWRVARNKTIDRYRRTAHRSVQPLEDAAETLYTDEAGLPEQVALREEEYARLRETLGCLPEQQQEVLRLRFAHDLRCAEIATVMGKREGAVRTLLSRALNHLRTLYERKE